MPAARAPKPESTSAPAPERRPGVTGSQRAVGPDGAAPAPPGPRSRPAPGPDGAAPAPPGPRSRPAPGPDGAAPAPPGPRSRPASGPDGAPAPERGPLAERAPGPDRGGADYDYDYDYDEYDDDYDTDVGAGAGLGQRVLVGVALAAVVFTAIGFGPLPTMVLVGLLTLLAVMELFNAMRIAGLRPATLLGLVGAVALPASTFVRGEAAYPLVVGLAVVFGMLWYLTGADTERPVLNLGLTLTGILWVGGLAGFAGLILREDQGTQLLLATILITATSDTLAYLGGRAYGTKPFHVASPNKTWEGTLTGFFGALLAGVAIGVSGLIPIFDVDGGFTTVLILALVVGVLAPIGDLAESLVKRDLGIKDMGAILPGHGGVLDRVDGLLFTLPGAYYVAVVYQLF
ncbi:MAG: CDP-archaeol synthase [Actinomycetota bacterium]